MSETRGTNWVPDEALEPESVDHEGQARVAGPATRPGGHLGALESDMIPSLPEPDGGGAPGSSHDASKETPGG